MLLSAAYFPTIEYFAILARYSSVYIEAFENYTRQTWRNRCRILTANGPMDLTFPVVHDGSRLITGIRVDYKTPWLEKTEYAIDSAYYNSPFFEYYRDELFSILDSRPDRLWDLDMGITEFFCRKIGLATELLPTESFAAPVPGDPEDRRYTLSPKKPSQYSCRPYWQVFRDKFGFVGNLSVMDLLFNEGPESICCLQQED